MVEEALIVGGKPGLVNTTIPAEARANFTIRLAPGQDPETIAAAAERLLREAAPAGAQLELVRQATAAPAIIPADTQPVRLALDAVERVEGRRPLPIRVGGTLPLMSVLAARGIPTVLTGVAMPDCGAHSPNERIEVGALALGVEIVTELYRAFTELDSH